MHVCDAIHLLFYSSSLLSQQALYLASAWMRMTEYMQDLEYRHSALVVNLVVKIEMTTIIAFPLSARKLSCLLGHPAARSKLLLS